MKRAYHTALLLPIKSASMRSQTNLKFVVYSFRYVAICMVVNIARGVKSASVYENGLAVV